MQTVCTSAQSDQYCKFGNFREGFYFSRNFAYAKFREIKTLAKWHNQSVIYLYMYIMHKSRISLVANMSFNAIHENKILAKISKFTVLVFCLKNLGPLTTHKAPIKDSDQTVQIYMQMD